MEHEDFLAQRPLRPRLLLGMAPVLGLQDDRGGAEARVGGSDAVALENPTRYNHALAMYGRPFLSAALSGWWRTWSRRVASPGGPHAELLECWRSGHPLEPTGELRAWLLGLGWDGVALGRVDAGRWLAVWQRERVLQRRRALPRAAAGPGVWRPPLAPAFVVGRTLFSRQGARPTRLRGPDGSWHEGPEAMDQVLGQSRDSIWASCPAAPMHTRAVLGAYFAGRRASFPSDPTPSV